MLTDVVDHLRTDRIGVPFGLVEEPLHAIRGRLPGVLGQLPTVAALDPAEQPGDKPADPSAGLRPLEAWPDPVDEPLQRLVQSVIHSSGACQTPMMPPTTPQSTQDHHPTQLSKLPAR